MIDMRSRRNFPNLMRFSPAKCSSVGLKILGENLGIEAQCDTSNFAHLQGKGDFWYRENEG